jgi:hypothetical protein
VRLGIVGHAEDKFTPETKAEALIQLNQAIDLLQPAVIVSGHCPLGGVDIWAEELAAERGLQMIVHAPQVLTWGGPLGYKARNLRIARDSDLVVCVSLTRLPDGYTGEDYGPCYHCAGRNPPHVKGGGCWTAWRAKDRMWLFI